jgi:ABC-type phosphate transport system substrate-binding protein
MKTFISEIASVRSLRRPSAMRVWLSLVFVIGLGHPLGFAQAIVLVGSGSSVPAPLYNKWALEYNKRNPAVQMKYVPMGTSEGINQVAHGSGDFGAGEAQLTAEERKAGNLIELPTVLIGIVPIYNLPGVHTALRFSGELLAEIFLGQVKTWNAPQIAKLNPFTWLYLRTTSSDSRRASALTDLLNWMYTDGQRLASEDGYAELPPALLAKVKTKASSLH